MLWLLVVVAQVLAGLTLFSLLVLMAQTVLFSV
jgi:hypothetical protein